MNTKDIFLGASDITDYFVSVIANERSKKGLDTHHKEFTIIATNSEWQDTVKNSGLRLFQSRENFGQLFNDENLSYIQYEVNSSSTEVRVYGDIEFVNNWYEIITSKYEEVVNVIEWIYGTDGQSIEIPVLDEKKPVEEMYPFLNGESLSDYYERFLKSSASILLLIGPPGTGKTTFIRGLLQHAKISAMVTYDTNILSKDFIFANFIEGDRNVMIVEDADNFLGARNDGNDFMHKFLNVGDGLVTTKNKKMIFSTNLPSIKDVDSALIRPGRCFDILHFEQLNNEQALALANRVGTTIDESKEKWSIADVFHKQIAAPKSPKRKMGFV
jgi:hypothetical protein